MTFDRSSDSGRQRIAAEQGHGEDEAGLCSPLPPVGDSGEDVVYAAYREGLSPQEDEEKQVAPRVSIVIPAYNEAERIVPTIEAIAAHLHARAEPWELILADDGSTDSTVDDVRAIGLPNLRVLEASSNGGKGSAVRRGVLAAQGDLILFADADQSTPISFIDDLIDQIEQGHDLAIGSRAADGSLEASKPLGRRILSGGLRFLVRNLFNIGIKDTQCGFKMFTAAAADDLFRRQRIDGFSFDLEVLFLAEELGYNTVEVPVIWHDVPGSTVDAAQVALRFLMDLGAIRLGYLRGKYDAPNPKAVR